MKAVMGCWNVYMPNGDFAGQYVAHTKSEARAQVKKDFNLETSPPGMRFKLVKKPIRGVPSRLFRHAGKAG